MKRLGGLCMSYSSGQINFMHTSQMCAANFAGRRGLSRSSSHLIIKGFGNAKVLLDGQELNLSDWQTQSVRDLFFFFLSQNKPLTKEQVAEVFWRELYDPAKIRLRFKNEMYRLRRAVGNEAIVFESPVYFFRS